LGIVRNHLEEEPVEIPLSSLSADALEGIVKDFILREGTDYGIEEISLEEKMRQVHFMLESGKAAIFFDESSQTCTLISS
jgi:uncharacterized protein